MLCTLLCTVKVYASLSLVMLKIIALITAGDADSSNLTANCRTLSLSCFMCFKKLFFFLSYEKNKFVENTFKNSTLITTDFLY